MWVVKPVIAALVIDGRGCGGDEILLMATWQVRENWENCCGLRIVRKLFLAFSFFWLWAPLQNTGAVVNIDVGRCSELILMTTKYQLF